MGRKPIGEVAMTGAERTRLHRLKRGTAKPVTKPEPVTKPLADALERATAHVEKASAVAAAEIAALRQELAAAKATIQDLRLEMLAQAQDFRDEAKRRAAKPKAEKPALPPDEVRDRRIKALMTENRSLRQKVRASRHER